MEVKKDQFTMDDDCGRPMESALLGRIKGNSDGLS